MHFYSIFYNYSCPFHFFQHASPEELKGLEAMFNIRSSIEGDAKRRGMQTVELQYTFKEAMPVPDLVKAKRVERGGNSFKRTLQSEDRCV